MKEDLRSKVIEVLRSIYDPEVPISIWDLGLVEDVRINDEGDVHVRLVLTTPYCPLQIFIVNEITERLRRIEGIRKVHVSISDETWTPLRMSSEGRRKFKEIFGYDIVEEYLRRSSV